MSFLYARAYLRLHDKTIDVDESEWKESDMERLGVPPYETLCMKRQMSETLCGSDPEVIDRTRPTFTDSYYEERRKRAPKPKVPIEQLGYTLADLRRFEDEMDSDDEGTHDEQSPSSCGGAEAIAKEERRKKEEMIREYEQSLTKTYKKLEPAKGAKLNTDDDWEVISANDAVEGFVLVDPKREYPQNTI